MMGHQINLIICFFLALIVGTCLNSIRDKESISVTALDDMCQQVTGDENATYYEEVGFQDNVPCKSKGAIIFLDKINAFEKEGGKNGG